MIEIEVDGQKIEAAPGSMIIEAVDSACLKDSKIPRFCYHKKLSIAANCRMCLVEVEKAPKPLPACATPVTPGMKVFTQSVKAIDAQKSVMEFLLINHPLDCPICDQGGACELQDISMGYGQDFSRYDEPKRSVKDENLGSLISTDMTRCIQCTRCVRFGQEVAGIRELGTIGRGDRMEIGSYLKSHAMKSELSGNIIDLCPVGALTSKPFRFSARPWELDQAESVAPHDGLNSNLYVQTLRGKIMRVVPRENDQINETWISDRDRFSYQGLYSKDRLTVPMIKQDNQWIETDWTTALDFAVKKLKLIKDTHGANEIAAIASPNSTLEEFYLLQKFMRGIGSPHVDHRLHEMDASDQNQMPVYPSLGIPLSDLEKQEVIVIVGSHINHEQPLVAHRIRKASLQGTKILCINPVDFEFAFECKDKHIVSSQKMLDMLCREDLFAEYLIGAKKISILLGALALNHPEASKIRFYTQQLAEKYQAKIGYLYEGCNNAGGWIAGCIPHRGAVNETVLSPGYSVYQSLQAKLKAYLLLNVEPDLDLANANFAMEVLKNTECVIALSAYKPQSLLDTADVILPIALFAENSGTYVNLDGQFQSFGAIVPLQGESRPAWKILRVLGNFFQLNHFEYTHSENISSEIKNLFKSSKNNIQKFIKPKSVEIKKDSLQQIIEWPIYRADALVRRAEALQQSVISQSVCMKANKNTMNKYDLNKTNIQIDESIADDCVWMPAGFEETP